jgi:hypothetical protein
MDLNTPLLILGLTEVVKKAGMNSKYLPLISVIFGAVIYGSMIFSVESVAAGALQGVLVTGLVSATDTRLKKYAQAKKDS